MNEIAQNPVAKPRGNFDHIFYVLRGNPVTLIAFGMFALLIFSAVFGSALVPYDPLEPTFPK